MLTATVYPIHMDPLRVPVFDWLRCIAMGGIVLAHVEPPAWLFQLRNFDVPLLVIVSGAAFGVSSGVSQPYGIYLRRRLLRIAVPVWLFFTGYFIVWSVIGGNNSSALSARTILMTYLFQKPLGGVGYVWLLFLLMCIAFLLPLLQLLRRNFSHNVFLLLLLCTFLVYLLLLSAWEALAPSLSSVLVSVIESDVLSLIPYACLTALGLCMHSLSRRLIAFIATGALLIFLLLVAWHHGLQIPISLSSVIWTQAFKYPPQLYFLSYAVAISLMLYLLLDRVRRIPHRLAVALESCSKSALWIYLWHIVFLAISVHSTHRPFMRFLFVLSCSVATALLQRLIVQHIRRQFPSLRGSCVLQYLEQ